MYWSSNSSLNTIIRDEPANVIRFQCLQGIAWLEDFVHVLHFTRPVRRFVRFSKLTAAFFVQKGDSYDIGIVLRDFAGISPQNIAAVLTSVKMCLRLSV